MLKITKKILIYDEQPIVERLKQLVESWGFEGIGISSVECIEDAINQNHADVLILAKEMKIKGPSLFDSLDKNFLKKMDDIEIDHEFGLNLYGRLREHDIGIPVIFITTDDLEEVDLRYYPGLNGGIRAAMIEKPFGDGHELKMAIEKCLNL